MARPQPYDYGQCVMVAVSLGQQLVPGTCEYALHTLIEEKLNLARFDVCYRNDEMGTPGYDPAIC